MFALTRQVRLGALSFDSGLCVGPDDLLQDVHDLVRSQRRALPVVDEDNRLAGVVARKISKPRRSEKPILIDHFESDQAVPGIESLEIIEIIDHHRIGNIETVARSGSTAAPSAVPARLSRSTILRRKSNPTRQPLC